MSSIKDHKYKNEVLTKYKDKDWNDPEIRYEILKYFDYCTAEGWRTCFEMECVNEAQKKALDKSEEDDIVTVFNDFVAVMKEHGYKYAIIYRYDRDNDGDWYEYHMREAWDEYKKWPDDCMNGASVNGIYADDINKVWDKVVEYDVWKNHVINPETDGVYDESIMSAGHTFSIIFKIDEAGFASNEEEFSYH